MVSKLTEANINNEENYADALEELLKCEEFNVKEVFQCLYYD